MWWLSCHRAAGFTDCILSAHVGVRVVLVLYAGCAQPEVVLGDRKWPKIKRGGEEKKSDDSPHLRWIYPRSHWTWISASASAKQLSGVAVLNQTGSFGDLFFLPRASGANFLRALDQIVAGMWIIIHRTYLASRVPRKQPDTVTTASFRTRRQDSARVSHFPYSSSTLSYYHTCFVFWFSCTSSVAFPGEYYLKSNPLVRVFSILKPACTLQRAPRYLSSMRCKLKDKHFM